MSFIKNVYLSLSGSVLLLLLNFFIGIILARTLAPDGLGQYSLAISLVTILGVIVSLGLGNASIYYINNKKRNAADIIQTVVRTSLLLASVSFVASLFIFQNEKYFGVMTTQVIIFVALYGFCFVVSENLIKLMLAFMWIGQFVSAQIIPVLVFLILLSTGYYNGVLKTQDALLYISLGQIAGVLTLLFFLRNFLFIKARASLDQVVSLAKYGSTMNLSYIALLLNNELGLFLIRQFTTEFSEVGYYRLAIRLAGDLSVIPNSLSPLFFSKWSTTDEDIRVKEVERVSRIFLLLTLAGILAFEVISEEFIVFIYGAPYQPAVPVLQIILIGIGPVSS